MITNHYQTVRDWATDLGIDLNTLQPSLTAFANMQRRVMETHEDIAVTLRERFVELGLPTGGFDKGESKSSRAKSAMPVKQQPVHTTNHYTGCAIGDGARVEAGIISSFKKGDQHVGDKISIGGDVTGSAVGSDASLKARDIITQVQKSGLDNDLKQKFTEAAEALANLNIAEGDKSDAADDLAKLKAELEKPAKDEGRIQKIWNRIKDIAPTVASILASAVSIGKIAGVVP